MPARPAAFRLRCLCALATSALCSARCPAQCALPDLIVTSRNNDTAVQFNATSGLPRRVFLQGGGLNNPVGVVRGPDGAIYVASGLTHSVIRYTARGEFIDVFASAPELGEPRDLCFGPAPDHDLFVASGTTAAVIRFDGSTGASKGVFASAGLAGPVGVTFGPDGHLYVASALNNLIQKYEGTTGAHLGQFGSGVVLSNPADLVTGPDGMLYVSSALNSRIYRFDWATGAGQLFAAGGALSIPIGIAFAPDGILYVANGATNNVARFSAAGEPMGALFPPGAGGLSGPNFLLFRAAACCGDINGDDAVGATDLAILLASLGASAQPSANDLNTDTHVDSTDLAMLLGSWGQCPE